MIIEMEKIIESYSIDQLKDIIYSRISKGKLNNNFDNKIQHLSIKQITEVLKSKQLFEYGSTSSKDYFEIKDQEVLNDADSVVAIITSDQIQDNSDGTFSLRSHEFGDSYNLCSDEKYREQPVVAFCSGVLINSDVIATTGHCINSINLSEIRFIFGFKLNSINETNIVFNNSEIYKGKKIINRILTDNGQDYALVKLDKQVMNHKISRIRIDGKISDNAKVHVIGHPCGLPLKVGDNAIIKDNDNESYFVANLDTYGGNAGSPVFNSNTHEIEGILARGETDFISIGTCYESLICPTIGCKGVHCTRTTGFSHLL